MKPLSPLLFALLLGCGFPTPDPGPVIIPDDDDVSDDDDSAADDDDAVGDDDDLANGPLRLWAVLNQTDLLGSGGVVSESQRFAIASFGAGTALPFGSPGGLDGLHLAGSMLHPERAGELDLCEDLSSDDGVDPLPATLDVGATVSFVPSSAAATLVLPRTGGVYSLQEQGTLDTAVWSIDVPGGSDWPPTTLSSAFTLPAPVTSPLPGPGNIGSLTTVQMRWQAESAPAGVEIVLFRWLTANQTAWAAVRCLSTDDGEMFVPAALLAPGNGAIVVTLSRGSWTTTPIEVGGADAAPHLGAVHSVQYLLTPG